MSTERKFTQAVSLQCSQHEFEKDMRKPLEDIGYVCNKAGYNLTNKTFLVNNLCEDIGFAGLVAKNELGHGRHFIDNYNPSLFLALASMSATETLYRGEWVVINDRSIDEFLIVHQSESSYVCVKRVEEKDEPGYFAVPKENFRKATSAEIITHFEKKDNKLPLGIGEYPYKEPQTKENQLPRFGEHIQLWNNGEKKLTNAFFVAIDNMGLVVASATNPTMLPMNYGMFQVIKYDHYIKFGSSVYIPKSEAFAELAESRGIFPEQIQIDFEK